MRLEKAMELATLWMNLLSPYCDRIAIAGSIRRRKPEVKDIELVCIPRIIPVLTPTLFDATYSYVRDPGFHEIIRMNSPQVTCIKGDIDSGKHFQLLLRDHGIHVDVFCANLLNWGYIFAIRTGPWDYSHRILGSTWRRKGYYGKDGFLHRKGEVVPVREEEDLYRMLNLSYLPPEQRFNP